MASFEIEFLPVGNGDSSGDAIVLRYLDANEQQRVGVIDGGYLDTGDEVCAHIRHFYGTDDVDFVVSSHPDTDHMSGLRRVVENMNVRELWMHVPWFHVDGIMPLFQRSYTRDGLINRLKAQYPHVQELVQLAGRRGTNISGPFEGARIGPFTVLSPSQAMYEGLLPQFRDTPPPDQDALVALGHWITGVGRRIARVIQRNVLETWDRETLREGGTTAAENESSVVLAGDLGSGPIILTGDAGLRALTAAFGYAARNGVALHNPFVFQIPHHGSRNNVSPTVLNAFLGMPLPEGQRRATFCVISAGAGDADHPRQVVLNALMRRGMQPSITRDKRLRFWLNAPARAGETELNVEQFSPYVEAYD